MGHKFPMVPSRRLLNAGPLVVAGVFSLSLGETRRGVSCRLKLYCHLGGWPYCGLARWPGGKGHRLWADRRHRNRHCGFFHRQLALATLGHPPWLRHFPHHHRRDHRCDHSVAHSPACLQTRKVVNFAVLSRCTSPFGSIGGSQRARESNQSYVGLGSNSA